MDDAPSLSKQEKLQRRRTSNDEKKVGRHSTTNLFNEIPFKRRCTSPVVNDEDVIDTHDRQRFGILMQFIFPWLPYQCLIRMNMAATYTSFTKTMKTTVQRLDIANDEQLVRRARVDAFKLTHSRNAKGTSPTRGVTVPPPFAAVRRPLTAQDFDAVHKIVVPFPQKTPKHAVKGMHAMSLVDDHLQNIGAFTNLTHLYVSIQNGAIHYWKSLPVSLVHLCLIHKMSKPFHKLLDLSHLIKLKSLLLHSSTVHSGWPDEGLRIHATCFPPNLISLKTKFSWLANEIQYLPQKLEVLECHNIACAEDGVFPEKLAHIGISGPAFNNRYIRHFPLSVTSVSLAHPATVKINSEEDAAVRARTPGWKRGHIDMHHFSLYDVSETFMAWFTSLIVLDFDGIVQDQWLPVWKTIAHIPQLRTLSIGFSRRSSDDLISCASVTPTNSMEYTTGDLLEDSNIGGIDPQSMEVPPLLELLQVKFPIATLLPHEGCVGSLLGVLLAGLQFGEVLNTIRLVFINHYNRMKADRLVCPDFETIVTPDSLTRVDLVYAMRVPLAMKTSASLDQSYARHTMETLKRRGVESKLYITLEADVDFSVSNGNAFAKDTGDALLDDFCKEVRQQELTWGWHSSHH